MACNLSFLRGKAWDLAASLSEFFLGGSWSLRVARAAAYVAKSFEGALYKRVVAIRICQLCCSRRLW